MPSLVSLKIGCYPHPFLDEVAVAIYSSPLKYNKLLGIVNCAKDRVLEIKLSATHCLPDFSPRRMIERWIKGESRWIETHLLVEKIKEKEKKPAEKVWHVIEDNAILHWPYVHHFHKYGIPNILHQMLFIPHCYKCNSPMSSPLDICPVQTLLRKDVLGIAFAELPLPFKTHDSHLLANNVQDFVFLRCPSHLETI